MKQYLYRLTMPALLLGLWLLLNDSVSPGNIVLGTILAVLLSWGARALRPLISHPKRPFLLIRLCLEVAYDIIKSNIQVAALIWKGPYSHTPGFIHIPIHIRDPHGLAALACIVTYTPGTVWSGFSDRKRVMVLHVLDLKDEAYWVNLIKNRYEKPLMEIFE